MGAARSLLRHTAVAYAPDVPQLLPIRYPVAVHRRADGGGCMTTPCLAVRTVDSALRTEVLAGLALPQKTLPPKLFYDAAGAALFERICELDEYYLTRAELSILRARAGEIAALVGPGAALVEYGSGAGMKVRLLLDAMHAPAAYVPLDISREQLARVVTQ